MDARHSQRERLFCGNSAFDEIFSSCRGSKGLSERLTGEEGTMRGWRISRTIGLVLLIFICLTAARRTRAAVLVYDIEALIDTTDQLRIKGSTLQWYHPGAGAAVGRRGGGDVPTIISSSLDGTTRMNGVNWTPTWPQNPPNEIRFEAYSSVFDGLNPALPPLEPVSVTATVASGRGSLSIVELPTFANAFTLVVQYSDGFNGSAQLEGVITVTVPEPGAQTALGTTVLLLRRRGIKAGAHT
jgi:hypothetical protein